jgi:hypothetical protein
MLSPARDRLPVQPWYRRPAAALLVIMPLVAFGLKCALIVHTLGPAGTRIFETGFGFGGYVRELFMDGSFRSCVAAPFARCDPSQCVYATRMPLLPLLYTGLAKVVGARSVSVAIAKCALTASLLTAFLLSLARDVRVSLLAVALAYALYLGPQVLKHGASLEYEEGLLVDLEACLAIAAAYLIKPDLTSEPAKRVRMALAAVLLGIVLYFAKTTALLMLLVVMALVLLDRQFQWRFKSLAVLCVLVPFAAWAAHNYSSSGALHLSSSWNGENLYRGSSSEGLALYPEVLLDRLFDSSHATLAGGRVIQLHNLEAQRCFVNEWAWSHYYSDLARSWLQQHPLDALRFAAHKIWVALFELRHTPYRTDAEGSDTEYSPAIDAVMLAWMGFARLVFLALVVCVALDLWHGNVRQSLWTLALVGAGWAPYLVVFAYQRHVVPLLVMAGFLLLGLYYRPAPLASR